MISPHYTVTSAADSSDPSAHARDHPEGQSAPAGDGNGKVKDKGKGRAETTDTKHLDRNGIDGQGLYYRKFRSEAEDLEGMMRLVEQELSEPYVGTFIYTRSGTVLRASG